ncbi:MAG TPA: DNA polymerase III subunit delta [Clostridiales bacterium]|nr:DNA polymerase III subunit delta [Clostridiales bacterium]
MAKGKTTAAALGYKELKAEIRSGQARSLYVLYGDESFLIDKLVDSLTELLIDPNCQSLDKVIFDGNGQPSRLDPEKLTAEVMTPPFLSRRKLVIVHQSAWLASGQSKTAADTVAEDIERVAEDSDDDSQEIGSTRKNRQDAFLRLIDRIPDSACLVFIESKVDKRLKQLVNAIEQKGVLAEISREQPRTLQQWVDVECRRRGIQITSAAAESLIDRCDLSMQVIWNELNKLFLYCAYSGQQAVGVELIAEISLPDLRGNIFNLTDALSDGQTEKVLLLVDTLISQRQPVQLIQFMLARHIRQLICAAELGRPELIASQLKVMPFVANRLASQSRRFPIAVLEELYASCFETDMLVKTGQISDRLALETLLVKATELAKRSRPTAKG